MEKEPKRPNPITSARRPEIPSGAGSQLPESPRGPMEFLSRSWSASALEIAKALQSPNPSSLNLLLSSIHRHTQSASCNLSTTSSSASSSCTNTSKSAASIPEDVVAETEEPEDSTTQKDHNASSTGNFYNNNKSNSTGNNHINSNNNQFSFAGSATTQLVLERIMSQSEVSPLTSGRLSHSSGPLNGGGSLTETDSPPVSPSEEFDDVVKYFRTHNTIQPLFANRCPAHPTNMTTAGTATPGGGAKTLGRWLKDRKEKKKEETRAHNAQLHATVSVAAVAAAVAAIAAATASSSSGKTEETAKIDNSVASAAALVAAQCVEAAETMGAERDHLNSVVSSAVNVKSHDDIVTLTAAAATALRGAATLKARALKEVWNIAAALPSEKGAKVGLCGQATTKSSDSSFSGELGIGDDFFSVCNHEVLAKGAELLKRTRKGDLHWKVVSVYINKAGDVTLKMKSKHVGGTFTKKKKNVVLEVKKNIPIWPGRNLFDGGEQRRYFGLRTETRGVIEFECRNQKEYEIWTQGVSRLLAIAAERKQRAPASNGIDSNR